MEPENFTDDYAEANAWQSLWMVAGDIDGLAGLFGSKDAVVAKLVEMFEKTKTDFEQIRWDGDVDAVHAGAARQERQLAARRAGAHLVEAVFNAGARWARASGPRPLERATLGIVAERAQVDGVAGVREGLVGAHGEHAQGVDLTAGIEGGVAGAERERAEQQCRRQGA